MLECAVENYFGKCKSAGGCEFVVAVAFAVGQVVKGRRFGGTGLAVGDGVGGPVVKECAVVSAFVRGRCFEVVREGKFGTGFVGHLAA